MRRAYSCVAVLCLLLPLATPARAVPRAELVQVSATTFSHPHDLVLSPDGARLYVADLGHHLVAVLDPETLAVAGGIGKGELAGPHDVTFDPAGRLLVADSGNDRIAIYEVQGDGGRLAGELSGGLESPEGVVALPDGRVLVTSTGGHNVTIFEGGSAAGTFGSGGSGEENYVRPHDIEVDSKGRLYVTDPGNARIHLLDAKLRPILMLGPPGHSFNEPKYLALDAQDRLYVADQHNNVIRIYDAALHQLATIPRQSGGRAARLNWPEGVTVRGDKVWVSDTYNNRILRYRLREVP